MSAAVGVAVAMADDGMPAIDFFLLEPHAVTTTAAAAAEPAPKRLLRDVWFMFAIARRARPRITLGPELACRRYEARGMTRGLARMASDSGASCNCGRSSGASTTRLRPSSLAR